MDGTPPPSPTAGPLTDGGFLAPPAASRPASRCVRCGKATPAGVALCPDHNPGRIRGPSATQVHGTVLFGVLAGFIGFLILARLAVGQGGPYEVTLSGRSTTQDGGVIVAFTVVNQGGTSGVANCRITRDGVPRPDDLGFRTGRIEPGAGEAVEQAAPAPPAGAAPYVLQTLSVVCT